METTTLESQKAELETQVSTLVKTASEFKITNDVQLQAADQVLIEVATRIAKVKEIFDPICEAANLTHKKATGARGALLTPLENTRAAITRVRGGYLIALENERKRLEKEAKDKADAAVKLAKENHDKEVEAARLKEEGLRVDKAAALEAEGKTELAEHVLSMPIVPPPPPPPPPVYAPVHFSGPTKTAGVSQRDNWKAIIETEPIEARAQLLALVKAAAEKPEQFLHLLALNASAINALAKQTKGAVQVPGFKFFNDVSTSVRTAGRA